MPSGSQSQSYPSQSYPSYAHAVKYKITEPPNPNWKMGQKADTSLEGMEWMKGLESGWQSIDTSQSDRPTLYRIMVSGIIPRPIAFVSSISEDGVENLGLFSWFNQVSADPPTISISCSNRETRVKDTVSNIRATRGFTVNIVSEPWVHNANICSIDAPPEINEWPLSGLTKEPSTHVKAPRVKESAFSMECELLQTIDIVQPKTLKANNTLILAVVKYIHIRRDILNERGSVDASKLMPVSRLGGIAYARQGDGFQMLVPKWENSKDEILEKFGEDVISGTRKSKRNGETIVEEDKGTSMSA